MQIQATHRGKHALITGGGSGIGLAIATALAHRGAMVTITGRRLEVLEEAAAQTPGLIPVALDVRDEQQVDEVIAQSVQTHGPIQICVANAAQGKSGRLHQASTEEWRAMMDTNVDGAFFTIRAAMRSMLQTDWGRVIAISSIAGVAGMARGGAYSVSKHALVGMIRNLAADFPKDPYTLNSICPGYVDTAMARSNIPLLMKRDGHSQEAAEQILNNANPHGRLIDVQEVAKTALWLCDPQSGSVTGQEIQVAGGRY